MYRKFLALACAAAVIFTSLASVQLAEAQRPWRKNMYNRFDRGGASQRFTQPRYDYRTQVAPAQSSERLSVEPIDIQAGDVVKVTTETSLRRGNDILATVPQGETFTAIKVIGPWVGIAVDQDGKEVRGWVNFRALETEN